MTREEVLELVKAKLDEHRLSGRGVEIDEEGVRKEDDWWYVPLLQDGDKAIPLSFLYNEYASIEVELGDQLNLMIVPARAA